MAERQMKSLFCERFACPPDQFEERALRRCLYTHARLLAPLLHCISARCFAEDLQFLEELGKTTGWREARTEILAFQEENRAKGGIRRNGLRLRASGRKAAVLAQRLFADERRKHAPPERNDRAF